MSHRRRRCLRVVPNIRSCLSATTSPRLDELEHAYCCRPRLRGDIAVGAIGDGPGFVAHLLLKLLELNAALDGDARVGVSEGVPRPFGPGRLVEPLDAGAVERGLDDALRQVG